MLQHQFVQYRPERGAVLADPECDSSKGARFPPGEAGRGAPGGDGPTVPPHHAPGGRLLHHPGQEPAAPGLPLSQPPTVCRCCVHGQWSAGAGGSTAGTNYRDGRVPPPLSVPRSTADGMCGASQAGGGMDTGG